MPWRGTALEDLDDDHATAAAWTSWLAGIGGGSGGPAFRFCNGEQFTRTCDVVGASAFGEQAVVADAVQALRQHVDEEAAVGDGNGVGVTRQIGQHCLRSAEWRLAVDDPFDLA